MLMLVGLIRGINRLVSMKRDKTEMLCKEVIAKVGLNQQLRWSSLATAEYLLSFYPILCSI